MADAEVVAAMSTAELELYHLVCKHGLTRTAYSAA